MPENLSSLSQAIQIADHLSAMKNLGELLELCREEFNNPSEISQIRISLLLDSYMSQIDYHFNELEALTENLKIGLVQIRRLIAPDPFRQSERVS